MTLFNKREKVIALRKEGFSYSQIKQEVKVAKSTLAVWLKDYPLSPERLSFLASHSKKIELYRLTMKKKRDERLWRTYKEMIHKWLPLNKREAFVAGLFLYWGEGSKTSTNTISLNNTDPSVLKFFLFWVVECLGVPKSKIKVYLHLYTDMNISREINYWSNELDIGVLNFTKPYIKDSKRSELTHKGFGHGTCGLRVGNSLIKESIMMTIKALGDYYSEKILNL